MVCKEVSELTIAVLADRLVQGDRRLDCAERLLDVLLLVAAHGGELFTGRLAAMLDLELATQTGQLRTPLVNMGRNADGSRLIGDRALAGLPDPPGRIRRELEALAPVELLDRTVESDDALLDEVAKRDPASAIALRDVNDEAQVGVDHALLRLPVAALDALGERDLLRRRQQVVLAELAHEQRHRVGHTGQVGLESKVGLVADGVGRIALELVRLVSRGSDLDSARLELAAKKRELVVVEIELDRLRLELDRVDDAVAFDVVDEARQFVRFKGGIDLVLLSLGSERAESPSLEALDSTPAGNRPFHAGVRRMTVGAHLEHELRTHGARRELVPAASTAHVAQHEVGVVNPLHSNSPLGNNCSCAATQ